MAFIILELVQFVWDAIIAGKLEPSLNNIILSLTCITGSGYNECSTCSSIADNREIKNGNEYSCKNGFYNSGT